MEPLTRYRGVDITPTQVHNLIKTIARQGTTIRYGCANNNDFERKVRDILLAYHPQLHGLSTDQLLIRALSNTKNKETTYNYNYITKTEHGGSEEENGIINVDKEVVSDNFLFVLKSVLGVKKLDRDECIRLVGNIKKFVDRWKRDDNDDPESILKCFSNIDHALQSLEERKNDFEKKTKMLEEEFKKTNVYERELNDCKTQLQIELNNHDANQEILKKNIDELNNVINSQKMTISVNTGQLLKMANEVGEKEERIEVLVRRCEELENENFNLIQKIASYEANLKIQSEDLIVLKHERDSFESKCLALQERCAQNNDEQSQIYLSTLTNLQEARSVNENLQIIHKETIQKLKNTLEKNSELEEEKKTLNTKLLQFEERERYYSNMYDQNREELQACKMRLIDKEQELNRNEQSVTEYMMQVKNLTIQNNELKEQISSKDEDVKKIYEEGHAAIEWQYKRENEMKKDLEEMSKKLDKLKEHIKKITKDHEEELEYKNEEQKNILNNVVKLQSLVQEDKAKWEEKLNMLEIENSKLRIFKADDQNEVDQLSKHLTLKEGELNAEKLQNDKLVKEIDLLQAQLKETRANLKERTTEVAHLSREIEELYHRDKKSVENATNSNILKQVKKNLARYRKIENNEEPKRKIPKSNLSWNVNKLYNVSTEEELQKLIREIKQKNVNHKRWDTYAQFLSNDTLSDLKKRPDYNLLDDDFKELLEKKHQIESNSFITKEEQSLFSS
ncbi:desmoplakin [Agrotis segetum granulovirus]|uniref:Desmoplakin n=1 Tax=Agrotis segetum granulosis virus TaxID=10464 RepID=A0A023MIE6_GVAS|nr:desmoplakin [Agrotis segetum granulovirus]AHN92152.1 hypothetical protein AsGV113 [Agrotis segetum granulovirus]AKN63390.1 desmoplakin [Agrotis segetum granulovirus]